MAYAVTHLWGDMDDDPPIDSLPALLDELAQADDEHTDVAVSHESGWTLSVFEDGYLLWENVEDPDAAPRQLESVERDQILVLLEAVARGDLAEVEAQPWDQA